MTQLAERVRRIEKIKFEKERHKIFDNSIREKIAYLEPYKDGDNSINYKDLDVNLISCMLFMVEVPTPN